jgi:hypothetical protein
MKGKGKKQEQERRQALVCVEHLDVVEQPQSVAFDPTPSEGRSGFSG